MRVAAVSPTASGRKVVPAAARSAGTETLQPKSVIPSPVDRLDIAAATTG